MGITGTRLKTLTFIIFAVLLAGCSEPQDAPDNTAGSSARPAKIVELQPSNAGLRRTYPGTLAASQQADLAFRVSGQLVELPAISGERVKAGDLLARLDPTDFENTIAGLQARFDLAKTQLDQARELLRKNLSSQLLFDQAESEFKSAQAALQQAKDNLRYTQLKAPFDGVIARVGIENYQPVQAQAPIIQIRTVNERHLDGGHSVDSRRHLLLRPARQTGRPGVHDQTGNDPHRLSRGISPRGGRGAHPARGKHAAAAGSTRQRDIHIKRRPVPDHGRNEEHLPQGRAGTDLG